MTTHKRKRKVKWKPPTAKELKAFEKKYKPKSL